MENLAFKLFRVAHTKALGLWIPFCMAMTGSGASVEHFSWEPIPSPQWKGEGFPVTVVARDIDGNVVTNFVESVKLSSSDGGAVASLPILGNLVHQDFSYNQHGPTSAGHAFTPSTDITVTHVRAYSGGRISIWTDSGVLLAARDVSDFGGRWVETPLLVPLPLTAGDTYRVSLWSGNFRYYWRWETFTNFAHGLIGPSYVAATDIFPTAASGNKTTLVDLRYSVGTSNQVLITPGVSGAFTNGAWTGTVAFLRSARNVLLEATDQAGHSGKSSPFRVQVADNLELSLSATPNSTPLNDSIRFQIVVSNSGPAVATGVKLTTRLSGPYKLEGVAVSQGSYTLSGDSVLCAIGSLPGAATASAQLLVIPTQAGFLALHSEVMRSELDSAYEDNDGSLVIPILPRPSISAIDGEVVEADTEITQAGMAVRLSYPTSQSVFVDYLTTKGSAVPEVDYQPRSGTIVFAPGETNLMLALPVIGDARSESNETFYVNLSNATNATIGRARSTVTIVDNDPLPSISISDVSVLEGNSGSTNAVFMVTLLPSSDQVVTVAYQTKNGSAKAGEDYTLRSGVLTFLAGVTNQSIAIPVLRDTVGEMDEVFTINLTNSVKAALGKEQATGTILNDDPITVWVNDALTWEDSSVTNATMVVWMSPRAEQPVTVDYFTADGSGRSGIEYVRTNGQLVFAPSVLTQAVQVVVLGDSIHDSSRNLYLQLTNARGAAIARGKGSLGILNDDPLPRVTAASTRILEGNTGLTNLTFQVSLSTTSKTTVLFHYWTAAGTATYDDDFMPRSGTVSFPSGKTNSSLPVPVMGDRFIEPDEEFHLYIENTRAATATIVNDDGLPAEISSLEWGPIFPLQSTYNPFEATVTARDYFGALATNYSGPIFFSAQTSSPTAILFAENFEEGNLNGWDPPVFGFERYITNSIAAEGTNSLFLGWNSLQSVLENLVPSQMSFWVRTDTLGGLKVKMFVGTGYANEEMAASFILGDSGEMWLFEEQGGYHIARYETNQWYHISLLFNWKQRSLDFAVNGSVVETNIAFRGLTVSNLTLLRLEGYGAPCWIDDIKLIGESVVEASGGLTSGDAWITNGVWTGPLSISTPATNMILIATNWEGYSATSRSFEVAHPNDLRVTLSASPLIAYAENELTLAVTAINTGPNVITEVGVTNTLPDGLPLLSAEASRGLVLWDSKDLIWKLDSLPPGEESVLRITTRPSHAAWMTNVAAGGHPGWDPDLTNNTAMLRTLIRPPLHHFTVKALGSTEQSRIPFQVELTARDLDNNVISNYSSSVSLRASRLFEEDFEDGNLDGWAGNTSVWMPPVYRPALEVTSETAASGNHALAYFGQTSATHRLSGARAARLNFQVRLSQEVPAAFMSVGTAVGAAVSFFTSGGRMGVMDNQYKVFGVTPVANHWYKISILFRWNAKTIDFLIDDELVVADFPFYDPSVEGLSLISLGNGASPKTWWDEIELLGDPNAHELAVTPAQGGPFTNGIWTGAVSISEPAAAVQLLVEDNQGHKGISTTFEVVPGPHGVFDHFEWSQLGQQLANRPFNAALTARDRFGGAVTNFNGPVSIYAVQRSNVQILFFTRFSHPLSATVPLKVISNHFKNFLVFPTTNTAPDVLRRELEDKDVFLIASQDYVPPGIMASLGYDWRDALSDFVTRGGIVILCTDAPDDHLLLDNSGLLSCGPYGASTATTLAAPNNHVLTENLPARFMSPASVRYFFNTNGTVVLDLFNDTGSVVVSRDLGFGHVVLFGVGMSYGFPSESPLDKVFANSVKWAQDDGLAPLLNAPLKTAIFTNGTWNGTITFETADTVVLQTDDGRLNASFSNPFSVGVVNDISLSITLSNPIAVVGEPLVFLLTVTNVGPEPATDVRFVQMLPSGTVPLSATPSQGTCSLLNDQITWEVGVLRSAEVAQATVRVETSQAGALKTSAVVTRAEPDFYTNNNVALSVHTVLPPASFYLSDRAVLEPDTGFTNALFEVTLYPPTLRTALVSYATYDVSALAGVDYVITNGVLEFPPGVTNAKVIVNVHGDLISEHDETFGLTLLGSTNALIGVGVSRGTILDNNDPLPLLYLNAASIVEGDEDEANLVFSATLSPASGRSVALEFSTTNGTATAENDFEPVHGLLMFAPGETNLNFAVTIRGDTINEPDEFFLVSLSNLTNALLAYPESSGVILNDDALPGKLDHYYLSTHSLPLIQGLPFELVVTAKDAFDYVLPQASADLQLTCSRNQSSNIVQVLTWIGCVAPGAYPQPLDAITNWFSAFHETTTTTLDPGLLEALLLDKDVMLIPAQPCPNMPALGTSWANTLNRFARRGGTIIVCSSYSDEHTLLVNSDLLDLSPLSQYTFGLVTNALQTALTLGVSNSFAAWVSTYVVSNGTVVLKSAANGGAVVIQRELGTGAVFLIGSGFDVPGSPLDRVLANALSWRFNGSGGALSITSASPLQLRNGAWKGQVTIGDAGTNLVLNAFDSSGRSGSAGPLFVQKDGDGDGLPDEWESAHGMNPTASDASADLDGDGAKNGEEFWAGTDPSDAANSLRITGFHLGVDSITLEFTSVAGRRYAIEFSEHVRSSPWVIVDTLLSGGDGTLQRKIPHSQQAGGFYRIRLAR